MVMIKWEVYKFCELGCDKICCEKLVGERFYKIVLIEILI